MQAALGLLEERTAATRKRARCLSLSTGRVAEGTAICGNGSIPGKAELGQAMARRREALTRIAAGPDGNQASRRGS